MEIGTTTKRSLRSAALLTAGVCLTLLSSGCSNPTDSTITATQRASLGKTMFYEGFVAHLRLEEVGGGQVFDLKFSDKQPLVRTVPAGNYVLTSYIVSYYQASDYCRKPLFLRGGQDVSVKVVTRAYGCSITTF